jgi:NTP pyrophosphatase (non-canonical NTP hydrolase)
MQTDHFHGLTPAEAERLYFVAEECGEVVHVIMKVLRHGYEDGPPGGSETNREALAREAGDLRCVLNLLMRHDDIDGESVSQAETEKLQRLHKWSHHQAAPYPVRGDHAD